MAPPRDTSNGFGLLELLGALTVFAIAVIPIFSLEGTLLRRASSALNAWSSLITAKNIVIERERTGDEIDTETSEKSLEGQGKKLFFTSQPITDQSAAHNFSFARHVTATVEQKKGKSSEKITYTIFRPIIKRDDKAEEKEAKSEKGRRRVRKKKKKTTAAKGKGKSSAKKTPASAAGPQEKEIRGKID